MKSLSLFLWNYFFKHLPGYTLRRFVFRRLLHNNIGRHTSLHRGLDVWGFGGITIGTGCCINKYASLDGRGGLVLGNNVSVSAYVKLLTAGHDPDDRSFVQLTRPIEVGDYAWIGTAALVLPGVRIGRGAVVAAGSVVTKDVGDFHIVAGNPARTIRLRSDDLDYSAYWTPIAE